MPDLKFLDNLKKLIDLKSNVHITKSGTDSKVVAKSKHGNVTVNVLNIAVDPADKENYDKAVLAVKEVLRPAFDTNEVMFLHDADRELVIETRSFESNPETSELIHFYTDKVSTHDLNLIRTGLYIENLIEAGEPTQHLTQNAFANWGRRGKNIVNLASAGYFSNQIRDLYIELDAAGAKDAFKDEYEKIVSEIPFAIFVNSSDTPATLRAQIEDKLRRNVHYRVNNSEVSLHGWGMNVHTIEAALIEPSDSWNVSETRKYLKGSLTIIEVRIKPTS